MRTGSAWTTVATLWTKKAYDRLCQLYLEEEDTVDHVWRCRCLKEKTKELDTELAAIDPSSLINSMRIWGRPSDGGRHEADLLGSKAG